MVLQTQIKPKFCTPKINPAMGNFCTQKSMPQDIFQMMFP